MKRKGYYSRQQIVFILWTKISTTINYNDDIQQLLSRGTLQYRHVVLYRLKHSATFIVILQSLMNCPQQRDTTQYKTRQAICVFHVILRRVRETIVPAEKQSVLHILGVDLYSCLSYPSRKVHAPSYIVVCGLSGCIKVC